MATAMLNAPDVPGAVLTGLMGEDAESKMVMPGDNVEMKSSVATTVKIFMLSRDAPNTPKHTVSGANLPPCPSC